MIILKKTPTSPSIDENFDKLSNYEIADIDKVKGFIGKHTKILDYIHDLTPLINDYFPNHGKFIEFYKK